MAQTKKCIDCWQPPEAHPYVFTSGGSCKEFKTMDLPEGMTCADCRHITFCKKFLGDEVETNTHCDWFPIRFYPANFAKVEAVPCPK